MGVITGWGIGMVRLLAWKRAAKLNQGPMKLRGYTVPEWRAQFGSAARKWAQVEVEATEAIAVETMARLIYATASPDLIKELSYAILKTMVEIGTIVDDEPAKELGWCSRCSKITVEHHPCI